MSDIYVSNKRNYISPHVSTGKGNNSEYIEQQSSILKNYEVPNTRPRNVTQFYPEVYGNQSMPRPTFMSNSLSNIGSGSLSNIGNGSLSNSRLVSNRLSSTSEQMYNPYLDYIQKRGLNNSEKKYKYVSSFMNIDSSFINTTPTQVISQYLYAEENAFMFDIDGTTNILRIALSNNKFNNNEQILHYEKVFTVNVCFFTYNFCFSTNSCVS